MHVLPSPQPPEPEPLPSSCYAGNPLSPLSTGGGAELDEPEQAELDELAADGLAEVDELDASSPPQSAEPQPLPAVTPRRRRSPTPVELQDTRLRTVTTPTYKGGESSARIHQRRRDREVSTQPSALPSDATAAAGIHQRCRDREASAAPSDAAGHIPSAVVLPPAPIDQHHYYSYQGASYPSLYPQQLHIPAHMHQWGAPQSGLYPSYSQPPKSRTTSPFVPNAEMQYRHPHDYRDTSSLVPPGAELQHRPKSAPLGGGTAPPPPARSSTAAPPPPSLPSVAHIWSPTPALAPPPLPSDATAAAATDDDATAAAATDDDGLRNLAFAANDNELLDTFLANLTPVGDEEPDPDNDAINPFTTPQSPANNSSPPASSEASKPKFKVGRRSKEDQEDWAKFVEQCDDLYLTYAKKKNMPMEQVFAQYSALKRRLNADSRWNVYQRLWAANLADETERARKHIADLISKGEIIKDVEALSTQALCSYGYAAYKLEYDDDWEERLELHSNLEIASGEPMDYRSRTKAWNKFIDTLNRLVSLLISLGDMSLTKHCRTLGRISLQLSQLQSCLGRGRQ